MYIWTYANPLSKQSELSLAYLHAVAAKVGFAVNVPHPDMDSVDAEVSAAGKVDVTSKLN